MSKYKKSDTDRTIRYLFQFDNHKDVHLTICEYEHAMPFNVVRSTVWETLLYVKHGFIDGLKSFSQKSVFGDLILSKAEYEDLIILLENPSMCVFYLKRKDFGVIKQIAILFLKSKPIVSII